MDFNFPQNLEYCKAYVDQFSSLLLYSHVPTAIIAFIIGVFVYVKSGGSLLAKLFLGITTSFALWSVADLMIWKGYFSGGLVMSFWAPIEIFSTALFLLCFYFVYVFTNQRDLPKWLKLTFLGIILSVIFITPTVYNLTEYDLQECVAVENPYYVQYVFSIRLALAIISLLYLVYKFFRAGSQKGQIVILGVGILFLLFAFFISGYIADLTADYRLEMYGLFGMMVFVGAFAYLIVKFKTFNIKLLGAQALVVALVSLIGAQFFYIQNPTNRILNAIALTISIIFGYFLTKSVKREVEQREKLEILDKELEAKNEKLKELDELKSKFLSFASHQVKAPMAIVKGYAEIIRDGQAGQISDKAKEMSDKIIVASNKLIDLVNNLLDMRKVEEGKMNYTLEEADLVKMTKESVEELRSLAVKKGLELAFESKLETAKIKVDIQKFRQVIVNFVDNSIKYTPSGWVKVRVSVDEKHPGNALVTVSDSGLGMSPELLPKLFQQFSRDKEVGKKILGTGLGLFIAKQIVTDHKGDIWAESEGEGKGSQFYVSIPLSS